MRHHLRAAFILVVGVAFARCPFSTKYFRTFAIVFIVLVSLTVHLVGITIIMFVNDVKTNLVGLTALVRKAYPSMVEMS
jgi:multidrug efflux pump subunit AcrB